MKDAQACEGEQEYHCCFKVLHCKTMCPHSEGPYEPDSRPTI